MRYTSILVGVILISLIFSGCTDSAEDDEREDDVWQGLMLDYDAVVFEHVGAGGSTASSDWTDGIDVVRVQRNASDGSVASVHYVMVESSSNLALGYIEPDHVVCSGKSESCRDRSLLERFREPRPWLYGLSGILANTPGPMGAEASPDQWQVEREGNTTILQPDDPNAPEVKWGPFEAVDSVRFQDDRLFPVEIRTQRGDTLQFTSRQNDATVDPVDLTPCLPSVDLRGPVQPGRLPPASDNDDYYGFPWEEAWRAVVEEYPRLDTWTLHHAGDFVRGKVTLEGEDPVFGHSEDKVREWTRWTFRVEHPDDGVKDVEVTVNRDLSDTTGRTLTSYSVREPVAHPETDAMFTDGPPPHRSLDGVLADLEGQLGGEAMSIRITSGLNSSGLPWTTYRVGVPLGEGSGPASSYLAVDSDLGTVMLDIRPPEDFPCDLGPVAMTSG